MDSEAAVSLAVEADHHSEPGAAPGVGSAVVDEEVREEDLVAEVEANDDTEVYLFLVLRSLCFPVEPALHCDVELMYYMHSKIWHAVVFKSEAIRGGMICVVNHYYNGIVE